MKISDANFTRLVRYVRTNYGINLERKRVLVEGRLSAPAASMGFADIDAYLEHILSSSDPRGTVQLINKLTTNHTFFMREPDHFEFMRKTFLPYAEATVQDKDLRVWCAACSNGAEPYTMAMVMDDYFGSRGADWDKVILATDVDTDALKAAKEGVFTPDFLNACPQHMIDRYFEVLDNGNYRVIKKIRDQVVFKKFNLMNEIVYKKPFDLISCRNVMIYFEQDTKEQLVRRLYECTKHGGYLFIGHAENIPRDSRYEFVQPAVFRKI
ncbi:MAG: protein-glutamate O-methyltransferase CheR [Oscillospiraceae bacterium]|nr:protein-glutamate O-methyltransferase CheR [Oscillospiraceae bacterium]